MDQTRRGTLAVLDERIIKPRRAICRRNWRRVCGCVVVTTFLTQVAATQKRRPRSGRMAKSLLGRDRHSEEIGSAPGHPAALFVAAAVEPMAILTGVAKVPDARMRGMALARFDRNEPVIAVGETLELDGGRRLLRQQAAERQSKSDESRLHIRTLMFLRQRALRNNAE